MNPNSSLLDDDDFEDESVDAENFYLPQSKKELKKERKKAQSTDRSQYKKSDQDQLQNQQALLVPSEETLSQMNRGRVTEIKANEILVHPIEDPLTTYICSIRGSFKKQKSLDKNLIIVGDYVYFNLDENKDGVIEYIEPRQKLLSRADNLSRKKQQLIAANVDIVAITTSLVEPLIRLPLIDRYLIAASLGNMTPIIVINKHDLLTGESEVIESEKEKLNFIMETYPKLGVEVFLISAHSNEGIKQLEERLKGHVAVFSGQSGVGKSSILNLLTERELRTAPIVQRTKKGSHTTSHAKLIALKCGGWCVDTPGIKSFGLWQVEKNKVSEYFTEISEVGKACKYSDCAHEHEEECEVKKAVEEEIIHPFRYESYLSLLKELDSKYLKR